MTASYRCAQCGVTSPKVSGRDALDAVRAGHRLAAHGGLIPDGEEILGGPMAAMRPRVNVLAVLFIGGGLVTFWQWLTHLF